MERPQRQGRVYVGFFSALDYWRGVSNLGDYRDNVQLGKTARDGIKHYRIIYAEEHNLESPIYRYRDVRDLGISLSPQAPLDILISASRERLKTQTLLPHQVSAILPKHSFVQARKDVLVATPEATFVQLARCLTLPQLLLVGMELCGTYALDGSGSDGTGFSQRPRLITVRRLAQYISWCHGFDGLRIARQAVRLLMSNSGSPGESHTILALTLPLHLRGLGLPQPKLNRRTEVTIQNKDGTDQSQYYYDFYWSASKRVGSDKPLRKRRVDGEYDSDTHHAGTLKMHDDAHRGNSVQYMGTAHVVITAVDLENAGNLMRVARQLSRCIWHRFPTRDQLKALEPELDELLQELREGKTYPVSLDSGGNLPKHRRPELRRTRHGRRTGVTL